MFIGKLISISTFLHRYTEHTSLIFLSWPDSKHLCDKLMNRLFGVAKFGMVV